VFSRCSGVSMFMCLDVEVCAFLVRVEVFRCLVGVEALRCLCVSMLGCLGV